MYEVFRGSFVALVTPFKDGLGIDFDAYERLIDFHLESKTNGIVPCGCTGEAATLSHEEQKQCIRFVVERVAGKKIVIAGVGSNYTHEAIGLAKYAKEVGADAGLSIMPYYNKPTPAGQIAHFTAIAQAVPKWPIVLYNVPTRTGIDLMPETGIEIAGRNPNVVAVKECGGIDHVTAYCRNSRLHVLSGDDSATLPLMAIGAKGVISVAANVVPNLVAIMCEELSECRILNAQSHHYKLWPLFKNLFVETNPMPVKAALARMGLIKNILRLPLTPALPATEERIVQVLRDLGVQIP